jgi:hypothetical protein
MHDPGGNVQQIQTNDRESFSDSCYVNQTPRAERELSAFIGAATKLFRPEQAEASTKDRLEEPLYEGIGRYLRPIDSTRFLWLNHHISAAATA